jgi:hypothetical protein
MARKITREEKLLTLNRLIEKYPEKKFLLEIRKNYE